MVVAKAGSGTRHGREARQAEMGYPLFVSNSDPISTHSSLHIPEVTGIMMHFANMDQTSY